MLRNTRGRWAVGVALTALLAAGIAVRAASAPQARREFIVTAYKYGYRVSGASKAEIRVQTGDLVKITFSSEDIAHSFTIDGYRIMKRADPGKPITIDFRAEKKGTWTFYCNLGNDDRCPKETRGTLIVEDKEDK